MSSSYFLLGCFYNQSAWHLQYKNNELYMATDIDIEQQTICFPFGYMLESHEKSY